ncbi:hypothetical protein [Clostridium perfringens]|uniref:hypothetical protein n=1 Tax=Clostridium perfringens TaxID=1502 RepID=UPI0013E30F03|nr:hypothetical protein [Clostridium perfringens]NGT67494.1 hypothetical protein [Clostridium perfringens]
MSKKITKKDLAILVNKIAIEAMNKNKDVVDNDLRSTIGISAQIASFTTLKVLKELDLIDLKIE